MNRSKKETVLIRIKDNLQRGQTPQRTAAIAAQQARECEKDMAAINGTIQSAAR